MSKMEKLLELSKFSNIMLGWENIVHTTTADAYALRCHEKREKAVRKHVRKQDLSIDPQEFIDALSKEEKYNPIVAGAILNALMYDSEDKIPNLELDLTSLEKPLQGVGMYAKGGNIRLKGDLGHYTLERAKNVTSSIEGNVEDRFAARTINVQAVLQKCSGDLFGWQSSGFRSDIEKDLTGSHAYEESSDGTCIIQGDLTGNLFGYNSESLKAEIQGKTTGKGNLNASSDSKVLFHKKPTQIFGEKAERLSVGIVEKSV